MWTRTRLKRQLRKIRNRFAGRFFHTRYGRELLISGIGPRVLTMTVDCGDHIMSFCPGDYIGKKVFRKGHFDRDHVDRLLAILTERGLLQPQSALLELGANIGTQTVYFALSRRFARIVSIEPDPRNFALLQTNIAQNNLADTVTLVQCAAGDSDGSIDFYQHRNNHGKSSAIRQSAGDVRISVPVRPVPLILDEAGVSPADIGLLWMDIEGYEPVACRSMSALMTRKVPLYTEFSPVHYGPEKTADFVELLARFYTTCLVFLDGREIVMPVRDIPVDRDQFDILLFRADGEPATLTAGDR